MTISDKGKRLLELYAVMAKDGYRTVDNAWIQQAYNDMEIRAFRDAVKNVFHRFQVRTLLDYGCGGSNYETAGFAGEQSAKEFFGLDQVYRFEPARNIDERQQTDAVVCFDVLEHIFVADVGNTIRELFSLASRLLVVNVACYSARAQLPNGENAHVTVRAPLWWKGMFDAIAVEFPEVSILLICSIGWRQAQAFEVWSASEWLKSPTFVTLK